MMDAATLSDYFCGVLMGNIADCISSYLVMRKVSVLELNAHLTEMSAEISARITPVFEEYGVQPIDFNVMSVNLPEKDKSVAALKSGECLQNSHIML